MVHFLWICGLVDLNSATSRQPQVCPENTPMYPCGLMPSALKVSTSQHQVSTQMRSTRLEYEDHASKFCVIVTGWLWLSTLNKSSTDASTLILKHDSMPNQPIYWAVFKGITSLPFLPGFISPSWSIQYSLISISTFPLNSRTLTYLIFPILTKTDLSCVLILSNY